MGRSIQAMYYIADSRPTAGVRCELLDNRSGHDLVAEATSLRHCGYTMYTVSHKKRATRYSFITLINVGRFLKFFH